MKETQSDNYQLGSSVENEVPDTFLQTTQDIENEILNSALLGYLNNPKRQPSQISAIENEHAVIAVANKNTYQTRYMTDKFFLTNFQETRNEKVQVIETFGDPDVTFFGERVKTYQGAGQLLEANSTNFTFPDKYRWASGMMKFYDEQLRGSKLAENNNIAQLHVGNFIFSGYFLNMVMSTASTDPYKKQFSFNFLVTNIKAYKTDELDIMFDVFKQLSPDNRRQFTAISSQIKSLNEQITQLIGEIAAISIAKSGKDNERLAANQRAVERKKTDIARLQQELVVLYKSTINSALEG